VKVYLATSNPGKVREIRAILDGTGLEVAFEPIWLGEIETGVTHLENARIKAHSAVRLSGRAVLAEDSGIEADALGGLPGVHSARFSGPAAGDAANNAKLLRLLDGAEDRTARYRAVAVLLLPSSEECVGEGSWEGSIAAAPRGDGGFGYDPVFVPNGEQRTAAELPPQEKDAVSHRGHALRQLVEHARAANIIRTAAP
jgi:XTP/dITP diphosphohydrolase